jgi:predicted secreted protein|tara:strand:- start:179 stop:622 length:444 start_codon:yes stop_codon:yes gene_type:complete
MAIFNGTDLVLQVQEANGSANEFKLLHSQNVSLSINVDTIDVSTKDSNGFRDLLGGQKSFSLSADGLYDFSPTTGTTTDPSDLVTQMLARTEVTFTFTYSGTLATGDTYYTGSGIVTSFEVSGGVEDAPVYSVSIEGSSAITQAVQA